MTLNSKMNLGHIWEGGLLLLLIIVLRAFEEAINFSKNSFNKIKYFKKFIQIDPKAAS